MDNIFLRNQKLIQTRHVARDSKGRDTRCDKSLRHVAATGCCNKSPRVTCENHCRCGRICRCDLSHEFKLVWIRVTYRSDKTRASDLMQQQCRRGDLSQRHVAAICRIVCLGLNATLDIGPERRGWGRGRIAQVVSRTSSLNVCGTNFYCVGWTQWFKVARIIGHERNDESTLNKDLIVLLTDFQFTITTDCRFSDDVTKFQTSELLILLRFNVHDV